ncbi:MAG: hypothetical protein WD055_05850 [Candidatus Dependentiae bacterium]
MKNFKKTVAIFQLLIVPFVSAMDTKTDDEIAGMLNVRIINQDRFEEQSGIRQEIDHLGVKRKRTACNVDRTQLLATAMRALRQDKETRGDRLLDAMNSAIPKNNGTNELFVSFIPNEHLLSLVEKLNKDDLLFLLKKANDRDMPVLQKTCTDALVQDRLCTFSEVEQLPLELAEAIKMERFKFFDRCFLRRGGLVSFQKILSQDSFMVKSDKLGKALIVRDNGRLFFYDVASEMYTELFFPDDIKDSCCGDIILLNRENGLICFLVNRFEQSPIVIYNMLTKEWKRFHVFDKYVHSRYELVFNQAKDKLIFCSVSGKIGILDLQTYEHFLIDQMRDDERTIDYTFNQVGDRVVFMSDRRFRIYDVQNSKQIQVSGVVPEGDLTYIYFNEIDNRVFFKNGNKFCVCNAQTGECKEVLHVHPEQTIRSVSYNRLNNKLFIETDRRLFVYDEHKQISTEFAQIDPDEELVEKNIQINEQKNRFLVQTNRRARLFDIATNDMIASFNLNSDEKTTCRLNATGEHVLIETANRLSLYSVKSDSLRKVYETFSPSESISSAFSKKGDRVLMYTRKKAYIYDVETGDSCCMHMATEPHEIIKSVFFNQSEDMMIVDADKFVALIDVKTKKWKGCFSCKEDEFVEYVQLNDKEASLLIKTTERLVNWTISGMSLWQQLNTQQCDFMHKISKFNSIISGHDKEMYDSLPERLKNARMFR